MSKFIPMLLIVISLAIGGFGYSKFQDSGTSLTMGDLELSASDSSSRTQAYILMGAGALGLVWGIGMMSRSKG